MDTRVWLGIILGYFALRLMRWLVLQEHKGNYIDIHVNFRGDCDYITYQNKRYYPEIFEVNGQKKRFLGKLVMTREGRGRRAR